MLMVLILKTLRVIQQLHFLWVLDAAGNQPRTAVMHSASGVVVVEKELLH